MGEIAGELATFMAIQIAVDLLFQDFTYQVISKICSSIDAGGQFVANLFRYTGINLGQFL